MLMINFLKGKIFQFSRSVVNSGCCLLAGSILAGALSAQAETVAHWDFSSTNAVDGAFIPGNGDRADLNGDGGMDTGDFRISSFDLSGNGNHLTAWTFDWMIWSSDSVRGGFSMQNGNSWPAAGTDSTYNSGITGTDAEAITPSQWTVEALFKSSNLQPFCTIVGRDGYQVGGSSSSAAALYFSTRGTDLAIEFTDVNGAGHNLQVAAGLKAGVWYSAAAVSDGSTLFLYLNGEVIGTLDLTSTGTDTALGLGYGTWTVARGMWDNGHVDRFFGVIDEVAISDAALDPSSFVIPMPDACIDTDHDGMNDWYELFFGLNPTNSLDAAEQYDADTLINFAESTLSTDPFIADTDVDGLNDDVDNDPLSRAVMLWGHPQFTDGDSYFYIGPSWWLGAGKIGGVWGDGPCWTVPSGERGLLTIDLDRTQMTNNLMLNLLHEHVVDCQVFLDLGDTNGTYVVTNVYGNLSSGSGAQELSRYILPLELFPTASKIVIDATSGADPYTVWVATLYQDADSDGLDAQQETQFGTLDTNPDCDADTLTDYVEAMVEGTDPLNADTDRDGVLDGEELAQGSSPLIPMQKEGGHSGVFQVERWFGIEGNTIAALTANWRYGATPDDVVLTDSAEYAPENLNIADDYGVRMRGTITAPVAGEYTFHLCGDDAAQVWLSETESPYERKLFLHLQKWTDYQDLTDEDAVSTTIELSSNQTCYVEILLKEDNCPEHVSLWWTRPGETEPEIIGSQFLHSYVQPADDSDGDGLPDAWEADVGFGDPNLPNGGGMRDADGDSYSDYEEYMYGVDPTVADEDADGLSGGDEVSITLTDPILADTDGDGIPDLTTALTVPGAAFVDCYEPHIDAVWTTNGTDAVLNEVNVDPWVSYDVTVSTAGMYRLTVDATCLYNVAVLAREVRLIVEIDGIQIDELWMNHTDDLPAYICYTPWLTAGEHTVKLIAQCSWWTTGPLHIHSLQFGAVDGTDFDENGVQDWMEVILAGGQDSDADGLTDADEVLLYGTNPLAADSDGDGLEDGEELDAGTDALNSDTDGDGISDGEEVLHAFTDALVADFGDVSTLLTVDGSSYASSICSWNVDGTSVYACDRNGSLEYELTVPSNGTYVLEVEIAEYRQDIRESEFDLSVAFDGVLIDRSTVIVVQGDVGLLKVWLPAAEAGVHTVLLKWNNIIAGSSLQVNSLRLLAYDGPDADENGQADWLDTRLDNLVGDVITVQSSPVSPICLEGHSANPALISVTAEDVPLGWHPGRGRATRRDFHELRRGFWRRVLCVDESLIQHVNKGIDDGWYANIKLNPEGRTLLGVSVDPDSDTVEEISVDWTETNILTIPSNTIMTIRVNDALLLTALPERGRVGSMELMIDGPSFSTNVLSSARNPVPYVFEEPGTYVINGAFRRGRSVRFEENHPVNLYGFRCGSFLQNRFRAGFVVTNEVPLIVEVVAGRFSSDPYAMVETTRDWSCPNLPTNLVLEADSGLSWSVEPGEDTGSEFSLTLTEDAEQTLLARLSEDGPIVDRTTVHPLEVELANYWNIVTTFPDGSSLVMCTIVLSEVPDDILVELSVIASGATFSDGSLMMTLTADDFAEDGTATYYMIRSGTIDSSCHSIGVGQTD